MTPATKRPLPRPPLWPDLRTRETVAEELMDDPGCDLEALRRTYALFRPINRLVAGWRTIYVRQLRPLLSPSRTTTLLDIGSGGGDVPRSLARWAGRDGLLLDVAAIDPDPRAHAWASALTPVPRLAFRRATSSELVTAGERFDIVTSNHVLHHLDRGALTSVLADSEHLARRLVVHNDIARSALAYGAYRAATLPLRRRTFAHYDGSLSVRRSYRAAELRATVADLGVDSRWRVETSVPLRVVLRWAPAATEVRADGPQGA